MRPSAFVKDSVALLAEGVDRNKVMGREFDDLKASPSSRRAWIEIKVMSLRLKSAVVALLAEGVDRNTFKDDLHAAVYGRPPRGGRG